jgi:hypothetical protein
VTTRILKQRAVKEDVKDEMNRREAFKAEKMTELEIKSG